MQLIKIKYDIDDKELKDVEATVRRLDAEEKKAAKSFTDLGQKADRAGQQAANGMDKLNGVVKNVGATIVAAFAVERVLAFAKEVTAITGEFQKFEAVLTNTLGSRSIAQQALQQIKTFAAQTNFGVAELTQAFVKLANQGFVPTTNELRKLADLANSTGKQFDQLVEAIIDAQTGEFERLKEFGIRASKEGERVTFTFKGVQTQTEFTTDAIRAYVLGLGELEGVTGSTAAISETLAGKTSNLGDAYDRLLVALGDDSKGLIGKTIQYFSTILEFAAEGIEANTRFAQSVEMFGSAKTVEAYQIVSSEIEQFDKTTELGVAKTMRYLKELSLLPNAIGAVSRQLLKENEALFIDLQKQRIAQDEELEAKKASQLKRLEEDQAKISRAERERRASLDGLSSEERDELYKLTIEQLEGFTQKRKEIEDKSVDEAIAREEAEMERARLDNEMRLQLEQEYVMAVQELEAIQLAGAIQLTQALTQLAGEQSGLGFVLLGLEKVLKITEVLINAKAANALATASAAPLLANPATAPIASATLAATLGKVNTSAAIAVAGIIATAIPQVINSASSGQSSGRPGFKDGVIDLQGPGTTRSDSIPANLSLHESVMTAEETKLFKPTLLAIRERKVDANVLNSISMGKVSINEELLISGFKKAVSSIPVHQTYFDENGVSTFVLKQNSRIRDLNRRYGRV